ncbi:MAG: hypothetical protein RLZZ165_1803 [Bacteroidota bacterium]|jgi:putative membrane protein
MDSKRIARYIIKLLGTAIAVWIADWILPGIKVDSILWALVVSFILGLLNTFIKPLLQLISIPFILVTFGLFLVVINAVLLMFASEIVPDHHFVVTGFWPAFWGSIIISIVSGLLEPKDRNNDGSNRNGIRISMGQK